MSKVKLPNKKDFSGMIYGVKFVLGVSEDIKDKHLIERLLMKGYILAESEKVPSKKELLEAAIALGIDANDKMKVEEIKSLIAAKEKEIAEEQQNTADE